jgi:ABC-2 type transport system permease protein
MLHEIRTTLRRRAFVIVALGVPLILGIVFLVVMAINRNASPDPAALARARGAQAGEQLADGYVDKGGLVKMLPANIPDGALSAYPDEAAAQAALDAGEIRGYYLIPAGYVESGEITYVRLQYSPFMDNANTERIEWVLLVNLLGDEEEAAVLREPLAIRRVTLAPATPKPDEDNWLVGFFPTAMALILYMVILLPAGNLVNAITDEKKNRVMEVLIASMSPEQMVTGKIMAMALLGLLQAVLWVGILLAVVSFGGQPLDIPASFEVPADLVVWSFVYGLFGYLIYGAQMAGVGALAPELKDTRSVSFVVMMPLIVVYMFLMAIVMAPDGPFALIASLFPLTSPVAMIARMTQTDVPLWQAVLAAVLQLLAAGAIVRLVARLFHAQHLLSGQPFSVGRYYRVLLGRA